MRVSIFPALVERAYFVRLFTEIRAVGGRYFKSGLRVAQAKYPGYRLAVMFGRPDAHGDGVAVFQGIGRDDNLVLARFGLFRRERLGEFFRQCQQSPFDVLAFRQRRLGDVQKIRVGHAYRFARAVL